MPSYQHHFLPLFPPVPREELEKVECQKSIPYETLDGQTLYVSVLGRPHTVDVISVTIPEGVPREARPKHIRDLSNHMLSVLRLTHDSERDAIRFGDGLLSLTNETDSPSPKLPAAIELRINEQHVVDVDNVSKVFCGTFDPAKIPILALLAESQLPTIPPHYKALSLIRALELLIPEEKQRGDWLNSYEADFGAIGISRRRFRNALAELRTRCAHGVSRGGAGPLVAPVYGEIPELSKLLNLLRRAVIDRIGASYGIKFQINEEEPRLVDRSGAGQRPG